MNLTIEEFGYQCDECQKKFNWGPESRWYGTWIQVDDQQPLLVFCSQACAETYVQVHSSPGPIMAP